MAKRPFYTHPQPGDHRWSNSFDLLFRGVDLVTGGQRLHRHADYQAALLARGEDPSAYATYLEAFKHACRRTEASPSDSSASSPD